MNSIPATFRIKDPFSKDESFIIFERRSCDPNVFGNVSIDDIVMKSMRMFIARELRPRLREWFLILSNNDGQNIDDLMITPLKVQNTIEELLKELNSVHLLEKIKKLTPSTLFGIVETESLIPQAVVFLSNNFKAFRKSSMFKKTQLYEILKDFKHLTVSMVEENNITYNSFVLAMETLFASWLGFGPILSRAMSFAYIIVSKVFQKEIYNTTGQFAMEDFRAIDNTVKNWLSTFAPQTEEIENLLRETHEIVCRKVISMISPQIYHIAVVGYPETAMTIETLRHCFAHSQNFGRDDMLNELLEHVRIRLLSVEEDTSVILDGYANCVHSLRELDPSCSFMHRVCGEIREFLKKRPDTVRKIINYITSVKREQLAEHLGSSSGTLIDEEEFRGTNDEFLPEGLDKTDWDGWLPDPPDAPFGKSPHLRQSADVFNMLISVYGSKEMFVKEYRKLLSERLTSFMDKDSMFESRYLEILKQRFNEGELTQCEVMLKDVDESLRIDVVASEKQEVPVTASIISSHFWPLPELDKNSELPSILEYGLQFYAETYQSQKPSRKLNWLKSWGWTDVDLQIGDTTVSRFVSNQHAAVLYLYMEKEAWAPAEVSLKLGITKGVARRRLEWWGNQGLLVQELPNGATSEVWTLVQNAKTLENKTQQGDDVSDDEDATAIEDVADAADALEAYWMYTKNYIAQNESVKAERIHKIFKMFASPSTQGPSLEVVNTFLFRKVKQNLLTFQSGSFRVVKDVPLPVQ